ncbi:MAG: molybdopterin-dependent oxidoreductase [Acidimicrobiia bacterium]|nr:molybdopterin-dependent oxidoreductase [Acidimicrobiia bacterium]
MTDSDGNGWHKTACILCSINCGLEVRTEGREITRVRGDKDHPLSRGYTCEKGLRVGHYQDSTHRLTSPLRRRADGSFEEVDWDTAIAEITGRFAAVRDTHGGESIFYYGGGGQGNHLGGAYATATRAALGSVFSSNALAQEKTGEFWVDGLLYGRPRCHTTGDYEHAEVAVFVGKNPWQSHGFPRARTVLKAIAADPDRAMIVIDPRRTETADLADFHLQVRPGTDAWCLAAMLGVLVEEGLIDKAFVEAHTTGYETVEGVLGGVDIGAFCDRCGVDESLLRDAVRRIADASCVAVYEDLGVQQAPNSTLNSYLEKLVYLLTGNFAKPGTMNIHTRFASLGGGGGGSRVTPVGGHRIVGGLIPAAVIPEEILTTHPQRFRAMLIESSNPAHSLPDSADMRAALAALDLVVVIDVAMTETARCADYVLPAASQYEKWETTFFNLEFPHNALHLRAPLFDPLDGTLPEPEIHRRLVRALGAYDETDLEPLREAASAGRAEFTAAFLGFMAQRPDLVRLVAVVLYETLGQAIAADTGDERVAATAAIWGLAQTTAMTYPAAVTAAGFADGNALFEAILANRSGVVFSVDDEDATWQRILHQDGRIHLAPEELQSDFAGLATAGLPIDADYPFVLSAGERRGDTANTIFRNPSWRKRDDGGALRMSPGDAARLGVGDRHLVTVTTRRASTVAAVEVTDTLRDGHVTLPNGRGLDQLDPDTGKRIRDGVAPNELTSAGDRDPYVGTPWHKYVLARVEPVPAVESPS